MTPFPFVVGSGRSGTTLLRAMLTSHPDLAIPAESYFITSMSSQRGRYEHAKLFQQDLFAADLARHPWFRQWDLPIDEVVQRLSDPPPVLGLSDAIRRTYAAYAEAHGKARYGDKTPAYVLRIPHLAKMFPESRFVHLIRDGRDVAASLTQVHFGPDSIIDAAFFWKSYVEAGRRAGSALGSDRYFEVRYEDLVSKPAGTLASVCDFINLTFDESMLEFPIGAKELLTPIDRVDHLKGVLEPPKVGLRNWRRDLGQADIAVVESVAASLLEELGYETVSAGLPQDIRASAASAKARAERDRALKRRLKAPARFYRRQLRPRFRVAQSYFLVRRKHQVRQV